ncbi:NosD domain-containing protein [Halorussus halophilus]|uniref:NosD domain-containing protein n=1 Tax=Halorussus halophilus TaxID=2650975 RepID=UPI00178863FF|nr:NosD domain-containing protein [Halorussus halophilus]
MIRRSLPVASVAALVVAVAVAVAVAGVGTADFGASATDATAATEIDSCTTIEQSGTYVLTSDIEDGGNTAISESCIEIRADGVTLDGDNHTLDGRGVSHTKGITVSANDVTIRNLGVNDWHYGIWVRDGSATIDGVRTFSNAYGVRLQNAKGSTVTNATVEDNLIGIYADSGTGLSVEENNLSGNQIDVKYADSEQS